MCLVHRDYDKPDEDVTRDANELTDNPWEGKEGWSMFLAQGVWWYFKIETVEKDGERRCGLLDEDNNCEEWLDPMDFRPICRYWPFHPSNLELFPNCGFSFSKSD